jgi:hypothetical protein
MPVNTVRPGEFGVAWVTLCIGFVFHIVDEALTGILAVYNPTVLAVLAQVRRPRNGIKNGSSETGGPNRPGESRRGGSSACNITPVTQFYSSLVPRFRTP